MENAISIFHSPVFIELLEVVADPEGESGLPEFFAPAEAEEQQQQSQQQQFQLALTLGGSIGDYRLALDYLQSRKDIDGLTAAIVNYVNNPAEWQAASRAVDRKDGGGPSAAHDGLRRAAS